MRLDGLMRLAIVASVVWIVGNATQSYDGLALLLKSAPQPLPVISTQEREAERQFAIAKCKFDLQTKYDSPFEKILRDLKSTATAPGRVPISQPTEAPGKEECDRNLYTSRAENEYAAAHLLWSVQSREASVQFWSFVRASLIGSVVILLIPFVIRWIRKGFAAEGGG
jgi:hypothetical protein